MFQLLFAVFGARVYRFPKDEPLCGDTCYNPKLNKCFQVTLTNCFGNHQSEFRWILCRFNEDTCGTTCFSPDKQYCILNNTGYYLSDAVVRDRNLKLRTRAVDISNIDITTGPISTTLNYCNVRVTTKVSSNRRSGKCTQFPYLYVLYAFLALVLITLAFAAYKYLIARPKTFV